jgi:hypothetical protein
MENSMEAPSKFKTRATIGSATSVLGYSKGTERRLEESAVPIPLIYCSTTHKRHALETPMSIGG